MASAGPHPLHLVIGNKNLSSWSLQPWVLLRQAGIAFEEEVRLFEEPGWRDAIVAHSPSRRVPALRCGDLVVWDSLAICEYIADLHPEAALWPEDRAARAVARSVSAEMHSSFAGLRRDLSMDVTARSPRRATQRPRAHETERDIERIQSIWADCRARFGKGGPFLFGRFSVADAMFAPVVWRFRSYDVPFAANAGLADEWYAMMLELPAMKAWEADAHAEVARHTASAAKTPEPTSAQHCFAVIFSRQRASSADAPPKAGGKAQLEHDYAETAAAMEALAKEQPGFLGIESAEGGGGFGITVSYWDSLEAIAAWKAQPEHRLAQARGRADFYARYEIRVCTVERGYKFPA